MIGLDGILGALPTVKRPPLTERLQPLMNSTTMQTSFVRGSAGTMQIISDAVFAARAPDDFGINRITDRSVMYGRRSCSRA